MTNDSPSLNISIPRSSLRQVLMAIGIVLVLFILGLAVAVLVRAVQPRDSLATAINPREYQAVFLDNGQVYFGTLTAPGGGYYYLRHVYYLAQQASPQGGQVTRPTLIKLGHEIHGPEDLMVINQRDILFVENLKPSGEVSKAIRAASGS